MTRKVRQLLTLTMALSVTFSVALWIIIPSPGGAPATGKVEQLGLAAGEDTLVGENALVGDITAAARNLGRIEGVAVGDSLTTDVERATPPPAPRGRGEIAHIQDSMQFVVRDASGKIKQGK